MAKSRLGILAHRLFTLTCVMACAAALGSCGLHPWPKKVQTPTHEPQKRNVPVPAPGQENVKTATALIALIHEMSRQTRIHRMMLSFGESQTTLWGVALDIFSSLPQQEADLFMTYYLSQVFLDGERSTIGHNFVREHHRRFPDADLVHAIESLSPRQRAALIQESRGSARLLRDRLPRYAKPPVRG